jgi:nitrate reductase NapD
VTGDAARIEAGSMTTGECHVSSVVVQARPAALDAVSAAIAALPGAEVHAVDPVGKLVVVITADSERTIGEHVRTINAMAGVFTASLVFHAIDEDGDLKGGSP